MALKLPPPDRILHALQRALEAGHTEVFLFVEARGWYVMPSSNWGKHSRVGETAHTGYYPIGPEFNLPAMAQGMRDALKRKGCVE
jgi:hypothetical protein